jgi:hypothetical protein
MTSTISTQSVLAAALQSAHRILEATMADVDDEVANRPAPGLAHSVGSSYAHAMLAEDAVVNGKRHAAWRSTAGGDDLAGSDRLRPSHADV